MKKLSMLLAVLLLFGAMFTFTACTPRDKVLKIYNWDDFIDESTLADFEAETGIKVKYEKFDTNEKLETQVVTGKKDTDLICPSDYILERMAKGGHLLELNWDKIPNYDGVMDIVKEKTVSYDPDAKYSVNYMWGTLGILYNRNNVDKHYTEISWDELWKTEHSSNIWMKDSVRDSFLAAMMYTNRTELLAKVGDADFVDFLENTINVPEGKTAFDKDMLDAAEAALLKQKRDLDAGYSVDDDKNEMIRGNGHVDLAWSGDGVYSMLEEGNMNLLYAVPIEGGNLWFDSFCIPKNAKNPDAAHKFINFMLKPEISRKNMEFTGYISPVKEAYDDYKTDVEAEIAALGTLSEKDQEFYDCYLEAQFPSDETLARCGVMRDFGSETATIATMWSKVVSEYDGGCGSALTAPAITAVSVTLLVLLVAAFAMRRKREA